VITIARWAAIVIISLAVCLSFAIGFGVGVGIPCETSIQPIPLPSEYRLSTPAGDIVAPAGSLVKLKYWDSAPKEERDIREGHGDAGAAYGDNVKLDASAPTISLSDFTSVGGATKAVAKVASKAAAMLITFGVIALAAAVMIYWFTRDLTLSGCTAALGVFLIAMGLYPEFALVLVILIVLLVIYMSYRAIQAKKTASAADAMAIGIDDSMKLGPSDLKLTINSTEYQRAQEIIDATVAAVKAKVASASEKSGGSVAAFLKKIGF
jgi:hypothetical protein